MKKILKYLTILVLLIIFLNKEFYYNKCMNLIFHSYRVAGPISMLHTKSNVLHGIRIRTSGYLAYPITGNRNINFSLYETKEAAESNDHYYSIPLNKIPADCIKLITKENIGTRIYVAGTFNEFRKGKLIEGWNYIDEIDEIGVLLTKDGIRPDVPISCYGEL